MKQKQQHRRITNETERAVGPVFTVRLDENDRRDLARIAVLTSSSAADAIRQLIRDRIAELEGRSNPVMRRLLDLEDSMEQRFKEVRFLVSVGAVSSALLRTEVDASEAEQVAVTGDHLGKTIKAANPVERYLLDQMPSKDGRGG